MAVAPKYFSGSPLVNYGGATNRMVQNKSAAAMRGGAAGSTTKPRPSRAQIHTMYTKQMTRTAPPQKTVSTYKPGILNPNATKQTPKPTTAPGIGKEWRWVKGRGWVPAWIGSVDPRNAAYWSAYQQGAAQYESQKAANARDYARGLAAQRESALSDLYSQNAALASRGLASSGGVGQAYDRLGRANAAALDQLSAQYGDVAAQNLANTWAMQQLDLMNQAARDYAAAHPGSKYLAQYLK